MRGNAKWSYKSKHISIRGNSDPFESNALVYQWDPSCLEFLYGAKNYPVPATYIGLSQGVLNTAQMCTLPQTKMIHLYLQMTT